MAKDDTDLEDELDEAREDDGQIYVDRDKVDFDPDAGLLSGTALDGTSDIPDPDKHGAPETDGSERHETPSGGTADQDPDAQDC
jgi:hypothetical protein